MERFTFGRWEIDCDPDATRRAYAAIKAGGPEECGCDPCKNYVAARPQIYSSKALALFDRLGISPSLEVEVYHLCRLESGKHLYGGWFHFAGAIASGRDARKQVREGVWQPDLETVDEHFSLGFSSRVALVRQPFRGLSLVQLEMEIRLPWVIASPEPS